ncbi:MAG TPA: ATP-binding protein [Gemmataceae bacterium]|jgi:hypothetical protein
MAEESSLETEMDEIRTLSALRDDAIAKRKEGLVGLGQRTEYKARDGWVDPGDDVEKGILSKVLWKGPLPTTGATGSSWADLPNDLTRIKVTDLFLPATFATATIAQDRVPVLRSAVALDALSAIPGQVLSEGALSCYFRIAYELNEASNSDQMMGGASAGGRGVPQTAFVTNWCVRAVQSLAGTLENTARMIESFSAFQEPKPAPVPRIWWDQHLHTQELSILTALGQANHRLLAQFNDGGRLATEAELKSKLTSVIKDAVSHAGSLASMSGISDVNSFALERAKASCQALRDLLAGSLTTTGSAGGSSGAVDLGKLKAALVESAKHLRTGLEPSRKYFRQVLDHELVAGVVHSQRTPDAAELLFACDGLSRLGREDGQALGSTLERVASLVTNQGRVPSHRPFDVKEKGYVLHVAGSEVIHTFAELSAREHWPVSANMAQRLLRHFTETWRNEKRGWRHERDDAQGLCQWWLCGLSVLALDAFVDMLDDRINQIVLRHFSVRQPGEINFELDGLFYPDYGLAALVSGRKSSADVLQRMRAHVVGVELGAPLHTAVFYGPPGTGKTTLPEALARTSDAPLVEVTPSDIVLGGIEKTEARARVVFEALSLLSHVVILFDEFDSILWDRAARSSGEGILQFVTPGMLPKLKKLYDRAKDRRTAFILSTNLIGGLDPAAIREGRFDVKVGIYPPDVISRTGRLWMELAKMKEETKADPKRLNEVVAQSAGLAMGFLAKRDRFTRSKKDGPKEDSPIYYILHGKGNLTWPNPEKKPPDNPMTDYSGQPKNWKLNPMGLRDWKEWKLVAFLDEKSKGDLAVLEHMIDKASKNKGLEDLAWVLNKPDCKKWKETLKKLFV